MESEKQETIRPSSFEKGKSGLLGAWNPFFFFALRGTELERSRFVAQVVRIRLKTTNR